MTPSQRAWLRFLTDGDRLHLFEAKVTMATRESCLSRGWTKKTILDPSGYEMTGAGFAALNEEDAR